MQILLNYIVILSLSLFVFSYDSVSQTVSELSSGPTIDEDSDANKYIETNEQGITSYKGIPFSGTLTVTYENGQLWSKGTYKDGKEDGAFEIYYENGQLERKANYKDGKLNGDWKYYNEDGTIRDQYSILFGLVKERLNGGIYPHIGFIISLKLLSIISKGISQEAFTKDEVEIYLVKVKSNSIKKEIRNLLK